VCHAILNSPMKVHNSVNPAKNNQVTKQHLLSEQSTACSDYTPEEIEEEKAWLKASAEHFFAGDEESDSIYDNWVPATQKEE
jgi:hypothetical protein